MSCISALCVGPTLGRGNLAERGKGTIRQGAADRKTKSGASAPPSPTPSSLLRSNPARLCSGTQQREERTCLLLCNPDSTISVLQSCSSHRMRPARFMSAEKRRRATRPPTSRILSSRTPALCAQKRVVFPQNSRNARNRPCSRVWHVVPEPEVQVPRTACITVADDKRPTSRLPRASRVLCT
jgi:hypothetical protein